MGEADPGAGVVPTPIRYDAPVVVTGGSGLLGREVVHQLLEGGCRDVRVVDLSAAAGAASEAVRAHTLDIRTDDLAHAFAGAQTVLHLAACQFHSPLAASSHGLPFHTVNVEGTRRVLDAARKAGVSAFVFVSTTMVYGIPRTVPLREDHLRNPLGPYGRSKLEAERLVETQHGSGLRTVIVRPPPILGPGRTGAVSRVFDWIIDGRPVSIVGSGENHQELASPEDCARAVLLAGQRGEDGSAYHCGAASAATLRGWISALIAEAGSPSVIRSVPAALAKPALRLLELAHCSPLRREQYEVMDLDYVLDTTAARERLGWTPRWGTIDTALAQLRWYRATRPGAC